MATTSARSTDGAWKIGYRVSYDDDDEEFGQGRIKRSIEALIPHRFCSDGISTAANNRVSDNLARLIRKRWLYQGLTKNLISLTSISFAISIHSLKYLEFSINKLFFPVFFGNYTQPDFFPSLVSRCRDPMPCLLGTYTKMTITTLDT